MNSRTGNRLPYNKLIIFVAFLTRCRQKQGQYDRFLAKPFKFISHQSSDLSGIFGVDIDSGVKRTTEKHQARTQPPLNTAALHLTNWGPFAASPSLCT
jgi:hypothetical protein